MVVAVAAANRGGGSNWEGTVSCQGVLAGMYVVVVGRSEEATVQKGVGAVPDQAVVCWESGSAKEAADADVVAFVVVGVAVVGVAESEVEDEGGR